MNASGVVLVHLAPDAGPAALREVLAAAGLPPHARELRSHAPDVVTLSLSTSPDDARARIAGLGVVQQCTILPPGGLAAADAGHPRAVSLGGGRSLGGGAPAGLIAGPCSVESEAQLFATADLVAEQGGLALRGGAYKPRSSAYAFNGLGPPGLELLARARARTGLPIVTEALELAHLDAVAEVADVIQLGARSMTHTALLFAAGRHPRGRPVLLKRGFGATIHEWLEAAELVLLGRLVGGHTAPGLLLCERGIRTFEPSERFTLDVAAIPIAHERTGLPVLADPSHPAGEARLVQPLARAAVAAGAAGLLVEIHVDPANAWSDGRQTLDPAAFRALVASLARLGPA